MPRRLKQCDWVWLAVSLVGSGILVILLARQHRRSPSKDGDSDNNDSNNNARDDVANDQEVRFPWEPRAKSGETQHSSSDSKTPNHPSGAQHEIMKELDFLSTMTFANGGLRAPSCFCCQ